MSEKQNINLSFFCDRHMPHRMIENLQMLKLEIYLLKNIISTFKLLYMLFKYHQIVNYMYVLLILRVLILLGLLSPSHWKQNIVKKEITVDSYPFSENWLFFYIITEVYAVIPVCILKYDKKAILC